MKRLDTDTLACVFEWTAFQAEYCQFGSGFDGSAWPRPLPAAFTLAAVCQTWRAVVLRTSFLWRDVQYCVNDELENDDVPLYIALLLERSGICTLNLVVQYTTFADTVKLANKTLSALMPRVRRLHVDVAWPCVPPSICDDSLSCLQLPTPHLEICSVFHEKQFDHELFSNVRWYPGAFLPYTPKLTVLHAGMIPLHTVGHALVNLITLSSFDQSWLGARISVDQILQRCPSLQSIGVVSSSISGHNSAQDPVETERPIIPISLQSIASGISVLLRGHGPVDFSGLTHLDLTEPADATIWSTPEASIFLSKGTFPRLVSLVIPFLDWEQNSDVRLFICAQHTQNLTVVENNYYRFWRSGVSFFQNWADPNRIALLPDLRRLTIVHHSRRLRNKVFFPLATFLAAREDAGLSTAIESCTLYRRPSMPPPAEDLLDAARVSQTVVVSRCTWKMPFGTAGGV